MRFLGHRRGPRAHPRRGLGHSGAVSSSGPGYQPKPLSNRTSYGLGALAVLVVVAVVFLLYRGFHQPETPVLDAGYGSVHHPDTPIRLLPEGAIELGRPDAPTRLEIFEDPLCPACHQLEHQNGQQIAQEIDNGALVVDYRFVNFLDPESPTKNYSTRAIAALQCVANTGSAPAFGTLHDQLLTTRQPPEGSELTNPQLADLATAAGAPQSRDCILTNSPAAAESAAARATNDLTTAQKGKLSTPTLLSHGKPLDHTDPNWLTILLQPHP